MTEQKYSCMGQIKKYVYLCKWTTEVSKHMPHNVLKKGRAMPQIWKVQSDYTVPLWKLWWSVDSVNVLVCLLNWADPLSGSIRECEAEPCQEGRLKSQFIKFYHDVFIFCPLAENFWAVGFTKFEFLSLPRLLRLSRSVTSAFSLMFSLSRSTTCWLMCSASFW